MGGSSFKVHVGGADARPSAMIGCARPMLFTGNLRILIFCI